MKKYLFLAMILGMSLTSCNNQNNAETSADQVSEVETTGLRIAYVELDSLMSQYELYKDYEVVLTKKGTEIQNTLE
jgi:outer membrane protein